ncbi:hypothetical protein A3I34_00035 [Candidatus Jorgensenbacteria bacterium RIFCSPLOWO2_02_FULL_45_12]|uniref:Nucleotidyl transferase AbiEii/AbiGii toxin family protein n=2 Tax=Candidatus Joergenseniibacteriota TaxID=1752739 RepID=A0A1F6BQN5_9BACT|nr:MAG: hypothetical protein UX22_C0028G0010 [Candidatus Jorgensenbacteria bacterium GW2011_GWA2_45_9]OGG39235.1 MAG: hypothetical protein A3D55_01045 [Candidatus Jorgensenbacteria bacterium RIFCSPHIGHO2_02_FULL_45_20]OGG42527.1 MAG: hypothetical protein A3I34_00035 [Candidatus Jorgensenbacteria bacterium RIFCSPLOWO2_02_FULL_45_12]
MIYEKALTKKGKELFSRFKSFDKFYLAGGTGLALQLGHRVSVDFDFFSCDKLPSNFLEHLEKEFKGDNVKPIVNNTGECTSLIYGVKVTFLHYPFPVLGKFVRHENINILNAKEIGASKAYSIGRRREYKDFVDIYTLIKLGNVLLKNVVSLAETKYGDVFSPRLFLEQLVNMNDIEEMEINFLKESIGKIEIENFLRNEVRKLRL